LIAEAARGRGGIIGEAAGGLLTDTGSDFQAFAGIGKAHQVQVVDIDTFKIAFGGVEHGFGQVVLTVAEGFGPGGTIEEVLTMHSAFDLDELPGGLSGARINATAPVEIIGPALNGAIGRANLSAHGGIAAFRTEFEVNAEGFEGAVGFAFSLGEEWGGGLRVES